MRRLLKYAAHVGTMSQVMLAYRVAFLLSGLGSLVTTLTFYFFWRAVYRESESVAGFDFGMMITYVIVAQVVSGLVGLYFLEGSVASKIRDGVIANELAVPMNFQFRLFCETIGFVFVKGLFVGALILATGILFLGVRPPAGPAAALLFVPSVALGLAVEISLGFLMSLTAFFTTNIYGLVMTRRMITDFLSGAFIPLSFFPPALQALSRFLPFQASVFIPVSIYLGTLSGRAALEAIALQGFWAAAAWGAGALAWGRVVRRLEVHGG